MPIKYKGKAQKGETSGKKSRLKPGSSEIVLAKGDNPSSIAAKHYARFFGGDERAAQRYGVALKRANPGAWTIGRKINLPKFDKAELNISPDEWAQLTGRSAPAVRAAPATTGGAAPPAAPANALVPADLSGQYAPPSTGYPGQYPGMVAPGSVLRSAALLTPTVQQLAAPGPYMLPSEINSYLPQGYVPAPGAPPAVPPAAAAPPGRVRYRMPTQMQGQNVNLSGYNIPLPFPDWSSMMQPAGPGPRMQASPFGSTPPGGLNTPGVPFRGFSFTPPPPQEPWWRWRLGMMRQR